MLAENRNYSNDHLKRVCLNLLSNIIIKIEEDAPMTEMRFEVKKLLNEVTKISKDDHHIMLLARTRNLNSIINSTEGAPDEKDTILIELSQISKTLKGITTPHQEQIVPLNQPIEEENQKSNAELRTELKNQVQSQLNENQHLLDQIIIIKSENNTAYRENKVQRRKYRDLVNDSNEGSEHIRSLHNQATRTQLYFNQIFMDMDFLKKEKKCILEYISGQHQFLDKLLNQFLSNKAVGEFNPVETEDSKDLAVHMASELKSLMNQSEHIKEKLQSSENVLESLFRAFYKMINGTDLASSSKLQ